MKQSSMEPSVSLLASAAHEVGHYLVFRRHFGIDAVRIDPVDESGGVLLAYEGDDVPPDLMPIWLVGLMAGRAGEQYWSDRMGVARPNYRDTSRTDLKVFNTHRREVRGMTERKALSQALALLKSEWRVMRRLTDQLARDCYLPV